MNINLINKMHGFINKVVFLITVFLCPFAANSQNCPIFDTIVLEGFCFDPVSSSGTLTIVPTDPSADYNYSIQGGTAAVPPGFIVTPGPLDSVFTNVTTGTYYIWLQEALNPGCFYLDTITILAPQDPMITVTNFSQNLICNGDSSGGGEVNIIGGVLPYTYYWPSTGETTNIASNLWAGWHVVDITDANGCTKVDSIKITNIYTPFNVELDTIQQVQCYGECNGKVALKVTGAVAPYTFNWSTGQNYFGPGPDTLLSLCQGGHQVLISDAYGCDTVVSFIIQEPSVLYAISSIIQPVQCYGFNDGQAYVFGTGGTGIFPSDYTYIWSFIDNLNTSNQDTLVTGVINDTSINLVPGIHYVTVTDSNGCSASDTVLITEPTPLQVNIPDSSAIYSYCLPTFSGSLVAQAFGGTPFSNGLYQYSWDNTVQLTDSVFGLHAGLYTVTVFDDRGCTASATFDLDSVTNTFVPDSVNFTVTHVSCYSLYDGLININSISGSQYPSYSYLWSGPPTFVTTSSPIINNLYSGNYAVTITDSLGCSMILDVDVDQPDKLQYGVNYTVNESCNGTTGSSCNGSIRLNITGGVSPYFYDNSFSGLFPIPALNQQIVVNDTLISGFCNGLYNMDITDASGCQGYVRPGNNFIANVGSDVQVTNPGVNPLLPTTSCFNSADGTAGVYGGANPILNYTWESDNAGLPSGLVLGNNTPYTGFLVGTFWLVAHYADLASFGINYPACDVPYSFTVAPGNMISSGALVTNLTCYGDADGAIDLSPSGDAPSFSILWDTLTSIPVANCSIEDQSQLAAGLYTVSITDADGCVLVETFSVNEPLPIIANLNINDLSCHNILDGKIIVAVDPNSGQDPYAYDLFDDSGINIANNITGFFNGLSGGDYTVTVTDSSGLGCSQDFDATIINPAPILASVEPNSFWGEDVSGNPFHIRCNGGSSGSIIVGSIGGTGAVNFEWKNSLLITVSTSQETGPILPAGTYTLFASDANLCKDSSVIVLNEPDLIVPNISDTLYDFDLDGVGTEVSCFDFFDGWALSSPSGGYPGVQGYLYNWVNSNGQSVSSQALASNLPALLSYTVTVTDMNGCSRNETSVIFSQPLPFQGNVSTTNYSGATHAPFSVNFIDNTISTDPFSFNWNWEDGMMYFPPGTLSMDHEFTTNNIGLNQVNVILTNLTSGCMHTVFFDINVQGIPEINNVFTPNSDGINDSFFFGEFGMKTVSVEFYNRWGQMVYTWNGTDKSWGGVDISGELVSEGVYFYALVAEGEDGHYYDKKGSVTLLK
jgi:gliding motility-associated-like protein